MKETKTILGKTREEVLRIVDRLQRKSFEAVVDRNLYEPLAGSVWDELLNGYLKETPHSPCKAEEAVAALMRRGLPKEEVRFSMGNITVDLAHGRYRIYREPSNYGSGAFTFHADGWLRPHKGLGPEELAEFLLAFDGLLPAIAEKERPILEAIEEIRRRNKAEEMAREIARQAFEKAFKDVLGPMKVQYTFALNGDGTVSVKLKQRLTGKVSGPVNEIRDMLSDPEKVKALLTPDDGVDMPFGRYPEIDMLI